MYSPVRRITPQIIEETMNTIMKPMAKAMVDEGVPFTGFLYGGLMLTEDGVKTIAVQRAFRRPLKQRSSCPGSRATLSRSSKR